MAFLLNFFHREKSLKRDAFEFLVQRDGVTVGHTGNEIENTDQTEISFVEPEFVFAFDGVERQHGGEALAAVTCGGAAFVFAGKFIDTGHEDIKKS